MFIHKTIPRSDPLYYGDDAVAARQAEWGKIIEFQALDMAHPIEKNDLLRRGKTYDHHTERL